MITDREREDMVNVLIAAGPFAYGKEDSILATADEWLEAGFSPQQAHDWINIAKCFDAGAAARLKAAGLDEDMAASKVEGQAIGARVAAGKMTVAEATEVTAPLRAAAKEWE